MEVATVGILPPEPTLPLSYWNSLSQEDRAEFIKLRNQLHQSQKTSVKDRRLVSFSNEMTSIHAFLERSDVGHEQRSVLAGVAFAGPFICVNTRQLKSFLGRCKSSINGSLQQLGYVAVRTKSKARTCVLSILPSLANEPNLLRQWTVRGASNDAHFCLVSRFQPNPLPTITPDDLNDERKPAPAARTGSTTLQTQAQQISNLLIRGVVGNNQSRPQPTQSSTPARREYDFDLSAFSEFRVPDTRLPEMSTSYSVDYLSSLGDTGMFVEDTIGDFGSFLIDGLGKTVPRSQSAYFSGSDWLGIEEPALTYE